jgi:hypothetical protein
MAEFFVAAAVKLGLLLIYGCGICGVVIWAGLFTAAVIMLIARPDSHQWSVKYQRIHQIVTAVLAMPCAFFMVLEFGIIAAIMASLVALRISFYE